MPHKMTKFCLFRSRKKVPFTIYSGENWNIKWRTHRTRINLFSKIGLTCCRFGLSFSREVAQFFLITVFPVKPMAIILIYLPSKVKSISTVVKNDNHEEIVILQGTLLRGFQWWQFSVAEFRFFSPIHLWEGKYTSWTRYLSTFKIIKSTNNPFCAYQKHLLLSVIL